MVALVGLYYTSHHVSSYSTISSVGMDGSKQCIGNVKSTTPGQIFTNLQCSASYVSTAKMLGSDPIEINAPICFIN
jgi:hypothetical protein